MSCANCNGSGERWQQGKPWPCPVCGGTGTGSQTQLIHQRCGTDHLPTEPCPADEPRDPRDVYGTDEHEAWLIEMERQEP